MEEEINKIWKLVKELLDDELEGATDATTTAVFMELNLLLSKEIMERVNAILPPD